MPQLTNQHLKQWQANIGGGPMISIAIADEANANKRMNVVWKRLLILLILRDLSSEKYWLGMWVREGGGL